MENLTERIREIYSDRKWVLVVQAAVGVARMHELLTSWGSETLVVASNEGTGDPPDTEIVYTRSGGETIVGAIRAFFESVEDPDESVVAAVDHFDPEGTAMVIAEPYATAHMMVGRRTFGVRRPEWWAWEDKMRVDALWEELGIDHAPYRIVPTRDAAAEAKGLAGPLGTVWVADNNDGWHGGGEYVRWVVDSAGAEIATGFFEERNREVRVMPFLEGLPCSIHGWVTESGVAVFLPVEILILRHTAAARFEYAGVSTVWDAPAAVSEEMRSVARKVGLYLGQSVGYRGPYGIDGILTESGFRPTELNPRMSAGAGIQMSSVDVPLGFLMRAEIEGSIDVDHEWLETAALSQREPRVHLGMLVEKVVRGSVEIGRDGSGFLEIVEDDGNALATVKVGPASMGSYVTVDVAATKLGEATAGRFVAEVLNLVSAHWDLGIPELEAAPLPQRWAG